MIYKSDIFFKRIILRYTIQLVVTLFILVFLAGCTSNSENKEEKVKNNSVVEKGKSNNNPENQNATIDLDRVYQNAEIMPEFIGGFQKFREFLNKNLVYPEWEKSQNIEGNVFITFIIEKDGSTSTFKVARIPDGSRNLGDEAVRVLRLMPKWTPAEIEGEKVRMRYTLPIQFKLP